MLGKRILVVDDETEARHLLRRYLQGAGYEVMTAPNAVTAFQLARTAKPDLMALNLLLPNTSGPSILELLKGDAITTKIPVIMLTVVNDDGQKRVFNATDYLNKPIEASDLLQRITTAFADQAQCLILLVTSKSEQYDQLTSALRQAGHKVTIVSDGRTLLPLVKHADPDMIILDGTILPMGGLALLQVLRSHPTTQALPIIVTDLQLEELGVYWQTLTPIGYSGMWGNSTFSTHA